MALQGIERLAHSSCRRDGRQIGRPPSLLLGGRADGQRQVGLAGPRRAGQVHPVRVRPCSQPRQGRQRAVRRLDEAFEALVRRIAQRQRQLRSQPGPRNVAAHGASFSRVEACSTLLLSMYESSTMDGQSPGRAFRSPRKPGEGTERPVNM